MFRLMLVNPLHVRAGQAVPIEPSRSGFNDLRGGFAAVSHVLVLSLTKEESDRSEAQLQAQ